MSVVRVVACIHDAVYDQKKGLIMALVQLGPTEYHLRYDRRKQHTIESRSYQELIGTWLKKYESVVHVACDYDDLLNLGDIVFDCEMPEYSIGIGEPQSNGMCITKRFTAGFRDQTCFIGKDELNANLYSMFTKTQVIACIVDLIICKENTIMLALAMTGPEQMILYYDSGCAIKSYDKIIKDWCESYNLKLLAMRPVDNMKIVDLWGPEKVFWCKIPNNSFAFNICDDDCQRLFLTMKNDGGDYKRFNIARKEDVLIDKLSEVFTYMRMEIVVDGLINVDRQEITMIMSQTGVTNFNIYYEKGALRENVVEDWLERYRINGNLEIVYQEKDLKFIDEMCEEKSLLLMQGIEFTRDNVKVPVIACILEAIVTEHNEDDRLSRAIMMVLMKTSPDEIILHYSRGCRMEFYEAIIGRWHRKYGDFEIKCNGEITMVNLYPPENVFKCDIPRRSIGYNVYDENKCLFTMRQGGNKVRRHKMHLRHEREFLSILSRFFPPVPSIIVEKFVTMMTHDLIILIEQITPTKYVLYYTDECNLLYNDFMDRLKQKYDGNIVFHHTNNLYDLAIKSELYTKTRLESQIADIDTLEI